MASVGYWSCFVTFWFHYDPKTKKPKDHLGLFYKILTLQGENSDNVLNRDESLRRKGWLDLLSGDKNLDFLVEFIPPATDYRAMLMPNPRLDNCLISYSYSPRQNKFLLSQIAPHLKIHGSKMSVFTFLSRPILKV